MSDQEDFAGWLARCGAELMPPTNPYELARFTAHGGTHIVYQKANGTITASGMARKAYEAWSKGKPWSAGVAKKARRNTTKVKAALMERDGDLCFFCCNPLGDDITVEHLVSVDKGGPSHMDNYALAHDACNRAADNLPLMRKITIHIQAGAEPATPPNGSGSLPTEPVGKVSEDV